jgi:hypothetical protein
MAQTGTSCRLHQPEISALIGIDNLAACLAARILFSLGNEQGWGMKATSFIFHGS